MGIMIRTGPGIRLLVYFEVRHILRGYWAWDLRLGMGIMICTWPGIRSLVFCEVRHTFRVRTFWDTIIGLL